MGRGRLDVPGANRGCPSRARQPRAPGPAEATFRVLTYNVNYGLEAIEVIRRAGAGELSGPSPGRASDARPADATHEEAFY